MPDGTSEEAGRPLRGPRKSLRKPPSRWIWEEIQEGASRELGSSENRLGGLRGKNGEIDEEISKEGNRIAKALSGQQSPMPHKLF